MISLRRILLSGVGLGAFVAAAPSAGAQLTAASAKWQAWVGCWQPEELGQLPTMTPPTVCVVPTQAASAVDIVTLDSAKVVSRYTVDASGVQRTVNRDGCTGWERARWSNDSLRVFLSSELTCGILMRTSTGVMSISRAGDWVTIDAVKAGGNEAVRATRYRDAEPPAQLPADVATAATLGKQLGRRAAVIAAGGKLTPAIIVEAMHALDTAAVQAWLVERHESYDLNPKTLIELADAGVPGSVTDVMVAASYPDEFHFNRGNVPAMMSNAVTPADSARIAADYLLARSCDPLSYYSPYSWGVNPCNPYSSYGYGYPGYRGYGYGYGAYGYGYGYGYGYYPGYYSGYGGPVVIVTNNGNNDGSVSRGRAVKGQGYTRGSSGSSAGSSSSYAPSSSGSSSSSSSSSGSSSSGGSSSSAGSSSSSGRTAVAKPPAL